MQSIISKEDLVASLKLGIVCVTFEKKDNTIRVMNCTLREDLIVNYEKKTSRVRKINNDIIPVFDIDIREWRSVRMDSIQKAESV
jgi:hypothetical protein